MKIPKKVQKRLCVQAHHAISVYPRNLTTKNYEKNVASVQRMFTLLLLPLN